MTEATLQLIEDRAIPDAVLLKKLDDKFNGLLPEEYQQFILKTDGGNLIGRQVRFLSLSERQPFGERVWEMNDESPDVPLLIIGHFCSATREDNFGYKLDTLSRGSREIYSYDSESGDIWKESDTLEEFIGKYSS